MRSQAAVVGVLTVLAIGMPVASAGATPQTVADLRTERISVAVDGGPADGHSRFPSLSEDGAVVVFASEASNLVEGDTNAVQDVFVRDRAARTTARVSVSSSGAEANGPSQAAQVTPDGRYVVFVSEASNLVEDDTNGVTDVFRHDRATGETIRVSVADDGSQSTGRSSVPSISDDGALVAFTASESARLDPDGIPDDQHAAETVSYLRDVVARTTRVLDDLGGDRAVLSGDGTTAAIHRVPPGEDCCFFESTRSYIIDVASGEQRHDVGCDFAEALSTDGTVGACSTYGAAPGGEYAARVHEGDEVVLRLGEQDTLGLFAAGAFVIVQPFGLSSSGNSVGFDLAAYYADRRTREGAWLYDREAGTVRHIAGRGVQRPVSGAGPADLSGDGSVAAYTSSAAFLTEGLPRGNREVYVSEIADVRTIDDAFSDDDGSIFEDAIDWLAVADITRGCGPASFCPDQRVTRGQLAAMLVRTFQLPPAPSGDRFADDDASVFEDDIERLAAVGITRGCNPPDNDRFCPDATVTRGEFAAFIARVLDDPFARPSDGRRFTDDDGSVFEQDIERLADAGVTAGCNPPDNDRFCPEAPLTRGQTAAFLSRMLQP